MALRYTISAVRRRLWFFPAALGLVSVFATNASATSLGGLVTDEAASAPAGYHPVGLSTLYHDLARHDVTRATLDPASHWVLFTASGHHDVAAYVTGAGPALESLLARSGAVVHVASSLSTSGAVAATPGGATTWWPMVVGLGISALVVGLAYWRRRRPQAKVGLGVHDAHGVVKDDVPTTTLADVAGIDEAVEDLSEIVDFLSEPEHYQRVGARIPSGALLVGPPGTGKTLLARALAGQARVPFFAVAGSDFVESFVGVGAKRVRDLFGRAKRSGRAIVFIDEIDAVAKKRSDTGGQAADSERDGTLIALLNELDGFLSSGVIVLAATNRPDTLDPALLRPGRLDRRVEVPLPDVRGREKILATHARTRPLSGDVNLATVAQRTPGFSGADLAQVVNEAAIFAARERANEITEAHFDAAVMVGLMGRARTSAYVTDADRRVAAWHEAGHTVCAAVQEAGQPPVSVSIVPRGRAGGVTAMRGSDDQFLSRSRAAAQLVTALGGRAAEEVCLGEDFTQGACSDLRAATELAREMVTSYGMTEGLLVRERSLLGPETDEGVLAAMDGLLQNALKEARRLVSKHAELVATVSARLLNYNTLVESDLRELFPTDLRRTSSTRTLRAVFGK